MTQQPENLKTIFFGTPRFAQIVLEKLIDSPYRPQVVITQPDKKSGRGRQLQASLVKQSAQRFSIEILQPKSLNSNLLTLSPKFDLAILVAYGKIIPTDVLKIPKYGFVNVHPSLLPKYRGPSPIQSAILSGEAKTGVSIMLLDEKVDHGPILAQKEVTIEKTDTHESLIEKLGKAGSDLLIETIPFYISGDLNPQPQNHTQATFTKHIKKADGYIDLENPPDSVTFDRMVRAFYPWPTVWSKWKMVKVSFPDGNGKWKIFKFLPGGLIQPEGKQPMSINEFKNGYPELFNQIEDLSSD